jgi:hypothetical protein
MGSHQSFAWIQKFRPACNFRLNTSKAETRVTLKLGRSAAVNYPDLHNFLSEPSPKSSYWPNFKLRRSSKFTSSNQWILLSDFDIKTLNWLHDSFLIYNDNSFSGWPSHFYFMTGIGCQISNFQSTVALLSSTEFPRIAVACILFKLQEWAQLLF